jgi:hypothetical protein
MLHLHELHCVRVKLCIMLHAYIVLCVQNVHVVYVAYIECMSTNLYLYVNWIHEVMSERFLFCFGFFYKLIVFYIMVYIEVFFVSLLQIST